MLTSTRDNSIYYLCINFAQFLLKLQFSNIDGFRNMLEQNKSYIRRFPESSAKLMQVIFIRECHWACVFIHENQVRLYDSAYTSVSADTFQVVACKASTMRRTIIPDTSYEYI